MIVLIIGAFSIFLLGYFIGGLVQRDKLMTEISQREQQQKITEMWSNMFKGGKNAE